MIKEKRCLTCMSNANIKCRSLTRRKKKKKYGVTHTCHTRHADNNHSNINNKNVIK